MDAVGCRLSNQLRLAAGLPLHPLNGQEGRQNEPSLAGHKKEEQRRVVMAYWRWRTVGQGGGGADKTSRPSYRCSWTRIWSRTRSGRPVPVGDADVTAAANEHAVCRRGAGAKMSREWLARAEGFKSTRSRSNSCWLGLVQAGGVVCWP
jgi:hypothetical protein